MRYWLGLVGCGIFWTGTPLPVCHSGKSAVSFQNELMKLNTWVRLLLVIALKASAGISLAPGDLLFLRPFTARVNSFHVSGSSIDSSSSRWRIRFSASGETSFLLLNSLVQCGCITLMFSLSVVALVPSGSTSDILAGRW